MRFISYWFWNLYEITKQDLDVTKKCRTSDANLVGWNQKYQSECNLFKVLKDLA